MEDEYQEILDETEDDLDIAQDSQDYQLEAYETSTPQAKESESLYNWFWKIVRLNKPMHSVKVGNLSSPEIGDHNISVRDALNLAELGKTFGHKNFGKYFSTNAKITAATSMAKKGWFMDLSISQKKVRERARSMTPTSSDDNKKTWNVFKRKR